MGTPVLRMKKGEKKRCEKSIDGPGLPLHSSIDLCGWVGVSVGGCGNGEHAMLMIRLDVKQKGFCRTKETIPL